MQTKQHSLIESCVNVMVGYLVAVASQWAIFPLFGIQTTLTDNALIGAWFTGISIVRSYLLRRWFTRRTENKRYCSDGGIQEDFSVDSPQRE